MSPTLFSRRFGPHFVQVDDIQLQNSSAVLGGVGLLSCKISQLQDKTVSWVRRLVHTNQMLLLTVAMHTYSSDARFRVDFQYPDDWRLRIENVTKEDEGTYECMISTHPPQAIQTNFYVSCKLIASSSSSSSYVGLRCGWQLISSAMNSSGRGMKPPAHQQTPTTESASG